MAIPSVSKGFHSINCQYEEVGGTSDGLVGYISTPKNLTEIHLKLSQFISWAVSSLHAPPLPRPSPPY